MTSEGRCGRIRRTEHYSMMIYGAYCPCGWSYVGRWFSDTDAKALAHEIAPAQSAVDPQVTPPARVLP